MENEPSLDQLALFVRVAELGSFSEAGRELGLQRSVVSRRVAALEEALGVVLLARSTRRVRTTTAGQQLLEESAPLVRGLSDALRSLPERGEEPAGELRITAPPDFGLWLLPPIVARLMHRYPRLDIQVELTNRTVDLEGEGFDAALRVAMSQMPSSSLRARRLDRIDVGLVGAPSYLSARGRPASIADLAEHTVVMPTASIPGFILPSSRSVRVDDMVMSLELVRKGVGVALLPRFLVREGVSDGSLVDLLPDEHLPAGELYLITPSYHPPSKLRVFREAVIEQLTEHPMSSMGELRAGT